MCTQFFPSQARCNYFYSRNLTLVCGTLWDTGFVFRFLLMPLTFFVLSLGTQSNHSLIKSYHSVIHMPLYTHPFLYTHSYICIYAHQPSMCSTRQILLAPPILFLIFYTIDIFKDITQAILLKFQFDLIGYSYVP